MIDEYPEVHQQGSVAITNHPEVMAELAAAAATDGQVDLGVQVAADGRVWVCVNGLAFLRFKPGMTQMVINL